MRALLILQLGSVGVWTRVCHGEDAPALMNQIRLELVLERFAPNGLATVAGISRITALDLRESGIFRLLHEIKKLKQGKKNMQNLIFEITRRLNSRVSSRWIYLP